MPLQFQGDNINVPGQVAIVSPPTSPSHCVRLGDPQVGFRGTCKTVGVNLNAAAPIDLAPLVPLNAAGVAPTNYLPTKIQIVNPSGDVHLATLEFWTGAGGTGTKLVTATTLTGMTGAATKFVSFTLNALTDVLTGAGVPNIYPRLTVAAGTAQTADLVMYYDDLTGD